MAQTLTAPEARELAGLMSGVLKDRRSDPGQRMAASVVLRYLVAWYENAELGG